MDCVRVKLLFCSRDHRIDTIWRSMCFLLLAYDRHHLLVRLRIFPPTFQAIVDKPELQRSISFTAGSASTSSEIDLVFGFALDTDAEIMGTQVGLILEGPFFVSSVLSIPRGRHIRSSGNTHGFPRTKTPSRRTQRVIERVLHPTGIHYTLAGTRAEPWHVLL